jgi:hypothetical protein
MRKDGVSPDDMRLDGVRLDDMKLDDMSPGYRVQHLMRDGAVCARTRRRELWVSGCGYVR